MRWRGTLVCAFLLLAVACGDPTPNGDAPPRKVIFVVAMENHDAGQIYDNPTDAPYIDTLLDQGARATNYADDLPDEQSEPHYVWMEAGTNHFDDWTSASDADPSASNSTASTQHLSTQITAAGLSWMTYQEDMSAATGACPVQSAGFYAAKHNPFVFFRDVAGDPPSASNATCAAHHAPFTQLASDLAAGAIADYVFITPNLCNDMHGASGCPSANTIRTGDDWLAANLPPILAYSANHDGVVLLVWDEPSGSGELPFIALGPTVKPGYASTTRYSHSSLVRSVEVMLGLPVLPTVADANTFGDLFVE